MVRSKKKEVLSAAQIRDLMGEKAEIESHIKILEEENAGEGTRGKAAIDIGRMRREVRFLEQAIKDGTPPRITGQKKDELKKEADKLAEEIRKNMPSFSEMRDPARYPGAIQKNIMWEKAQQANVLKWKQIQRILEPQNPTASNVEMLRDPK